MSSDPKNTRRMGFVLIENFALMSYASATEPLRAANLLSGLPLYDILPLSVDGRPVTSSSGIAVSCSPIASEGEHCHSVFVCAGGVPRNWSGNESLISALRRISRQGVRIGAISSGAYILAAAGLLDNRDFTIHWEHAAVLREAFPHLNPRQARYIFDGDRITCGGGIAPLDMMHRLIAERMGPHFARRVSDWFLQTTVAEPAAPQRGSASHRFGTHHPGLLAVLEKMELTVEQPLSRTTMAAFAGISARHLDRLFASEVASSFSETYRRIRLEYARKLLEQSPLSIAEIAFATGFSSAGHFSRCFLSAFGQTPHKMRKRNLDP